jgi:DNA gyrase subunit A
MKLRGDDEVIEIAIAHDDDDLLVVTENGFGKRTRIGEYRLTGRGGLGVKTVKLTEARGKLAGARVVHDGLHLMLISTAGTVIRMAVIAVKRLGRATQGVTVMRLRGADEKVSSLALVAESDDVPEIEDVEASGEADAGPALEQTELPRDEPEEI